MINRKIDHYSIQIDLIKTDSSGSFKVIDSEELYESNDLELVKEKFEIIKSLEDFLN